ncbi:hypothetical protein NP493_1677g00016 [Ridgeia piscesae]|uniref:Uncharacterized protein n=1 Tax=Ridgeia piscesae TaxID=27915 RepID=A0AAD9JWV7_RIDPI|nr:hypothetical protein NP493_1677g00016 [Ridgeia piscesae]
MLVSVLAIVAALGVFADCKTFTIGYLSTLDRIGHMQGSAINIALESFRAGGSLQEHEFKIVWKPGGCIPPQGTAAIIQFHDIYDVNVVLGPMCSPGRR